MRIAAIVAATFGLMLAGLALAEPAAGADLTVGITPEIGSVTVETEEGPMEIRRNQEENHVLSGEFAKTSRACPPFCIRPMALGGGVTTIGELELIAMLQEPEMAVVDSRMPDLHIAGSIPGAVNLPYFEMGERLTELGCEPDFDGWDCAAAKKVALFCNGPWCGQSPAAIRVMLDAGYPGDRIYWYRGGMQAWHMLGLTVTGAGG
ncbi:rhodanese-like domain-containing protein [Oricola sp.]|uniref:rhodanese-like domain-containing protein n=1 Tax=Oricola sp. TaxID=1979950 RepID=UPI003BAA8ABC